MRILHILDHSIPLQSGYTFRTRNILREQRKLGWETSHVTGIKHLGSSVAQEEVDGLLFYRTPNSRSFINLIPVLNQWHVINTLANRIEEIVAIEKPDILHAHSPALNGLAALRVAKKHALPLVYECRAFWEDAAVDHGTSRQGGVRYCLTRAMESNVFRRADAVTTICEGLRRDIVGRGLEDKKITVIPNAVNTEDFSYSPPVNEPLKKKLGLTGKTVIGFIGSFYAYEGLLLFLEALPGILSEHPELAVLLVGGGPDFDAVTEKIRALNLEGSVVCTGRVPHEKVTDYYSLLDVLVYPRLPMRLTELVTPLKPLEAMAQGKLVLASDVGGHTELIEDTRTGFLFKAGSSESLAKAVLNIMRNRDRWDEIRRNGRKFCEDSRSWPTSVDRYRKVYDQLVSEFT